MKDYDLWIVSKGEGELVVDGKPRKIRAPQAFVYTPGQRVQGRHNPKNPLEVWIFHFLPLKKNHRAGLKKWAKLCDGMAIRNLSEITSLLEIQIKQESNRDDLAKLQTEKLAWLVCSLLWRQAHQPPPLPSDHHIEALIQEIRVHPEKEWSLEFMTKMAGVASTQLSERFHALTGISPMQFIIHARIRHASTLLKETQMPLAQIAEACGYRDVFFFSRQFKRVCGTSPAKYRKAK